MYLSYNINAIHILEKNLDKIDWMYLSYNINAIHLLENNLNNTHGYGLSINKNAINILQKNISRIYFRIISANLNIFDLDYKFLKSRMDIIKEELMMKVYHLYYSNINHIYILLIFTFLIKIII